MPEKWILFDVGGVLEVVDDDAWQDQWWARWCREADVPRQEADERLAAAALPRIDLEAGVAEAFWKGLGAVLRLDSDRQAQMRAEFWESYCGHADSELIAHAATLRGRARVAILSNSADGAREEEERRYGFSAVFDPICYSHELGVAKPDGRSYRSALQRMGAAPEDVLFIDDHVEAVRGAREIGMSALLHRTTPQTVAAIEQFLRA